MTNVNFSAIESAGQHPGDVWPGVFCWSLEDLDSLLEGVDVSTVVVPLPADLPSFHTQVCYLIHFDEPFGHARHYLGTAHHWNIRIAEHARGHGATLLRHVNEAGISWRVVRFWRGGRDVERWLKSYHSGVRLCPLCSARPAGSVRRRRRSVDVSGVPF